ncbi:MAG: RnfABCDGE type electron transport complex subunit D, partial [Rikenellaceae bacterium]|nr:RnfABCDGE type electron transport complex subunit D [Rikenellaceae bacterium]
RRLYPDGSTGELGALAVLSGRNYLLIRRVITWRIPVFVLGSMGVFAAILWLANPEQYMNPLFHLFAGGAMLGAIYMATDYVTSPMSKAGQVIYAVGIGVITILIRVWGAYPEGISFAILIMNATVPLFNMYVKPSRFGGRSPKKK